MPTQIHRSSHHQLDSPTAGFGQPVPVTHHKTQLFRRSPSLLVRETMARELDERRADWGYSAPVVALDMMWNIAFVVVSVLIWTVDERPNVPVRVWICGYALQCLIHVALVWFEYRRRVLRGAGSRRGEGSRRGGGGGDDETVAAPTAGIESGDEEYGRVGTFGVSSQIRFNCIRRIMKGKNIMHKQNNERYSRCA